MCLGAARPPPPPGPRPPSSPTAAPAPASPAFWGGPQGPFCSTPEMFPSTGVTGVARCRSPDVVWFVPGLNGMRGTPPPSFRKPWGPDSGTQSKGE